MRLLIGIFDSQFEKLHVRSLDLLGQLGDSHLFQRPSPVAETPETHSPGELLIRSAAAVEQVFGGLTRRLWDDPFEWTLPEELSNVNAVASYISEIRIARIGGLEFLKDDRDLLREIPSPEALHPIAEILIDALTRAHYLQGRAAGIAQQIVTLKPIFL